MGKNSPKQGKELEKQIVAVLPHATAESKMTALTILKNKKLPDTVAVIPGEAEDRLYEISFLHCRHNLCDVGGVNKSAFQKIFEVLYRVNICKAGELKDMGIIRDSIERGGAYRNLYDGIGKDIKILEASISGSGRIFFFLTDSKFNVVSVEGTHR